MLTFGGFERWKLFFGLVCVVRGGLCSLSLVFCFGLG